MYSWSPISWQKFLYEQSIAYPNEYELIHVVNQLSCLPPLVTQQEIKQLKQAIASAGRKEAFILQGGDCAESFNECNSTIITKKIKIILQMGFIILQAINKPVVHIGRIAGQFVKPRSSLIETINNITLPSYRGDLVNLPQFDASSRCPNPQLMLQGYHCAAKTINYMQKILRQYNKILQPGSSTSRYIDKIKFYTSHEALHLYYEQSLTRRLNDGLWYDLSTHLPWLGVRTASLKSSHLEFLRGIQNPIGIKIGPNATTEWLTKIIQILNPHHEEGRLLLITRFGVDKVKKCLPSLIKAVQASYCPVTWSCDPMHGNTKVTVNGIKTRYFDNILAELKLTAQIHHNMNNYLGGVHLELTGENVTECIGGTSGVREDDLPSAYHSLVDPRLNYQQALEIAVQLTHIMNYMQKINV